MSLSHMGYSQQKNDAFITQVRLLFLCSKGICNISFYRVGALHWRKKGPGPPTHFLSLSLAHSPAISLSTPAYTVHTHTQTLPQNLGILSCHESNLHLEICSVFAQLHSLKRPSWPLIKLQSISKYSQFSLLGSIFYLYLCKFFTMVKSHNIKHTIITIFNYTI